MYQKYIALGRTTDDFKMRFTTDGTPVANFQLAINRGSNGKADFIPCVIWEEKAKKHTSTIGKGSMILVEGEWRNSDKESTLQLEVHTIKYKHKDLKPVGNDSNNVKNKE